VLGTNGLFDNMWDDEIVSTVNQTMGVKMGDQHADEVSTELVPTTTMPLGTNIQSIPALTQTDFLSLKRN